MKRIWLAAACAAIMGAAGAAQAREGADAPTPLNTKAARAGTWGFDLSGMNRQAKPGDSFFEYANGVALQKMVIPADRTTWGVSSVLQELNENRLQAMIEEFGAKPNAAGDEAKISAYFRSFMDEARLEALDDAPLQRELKEVRVSNSHRELARLMGYAHGGYGETFFAGTVNEDAKVPGKNVVLLYQAGLGLPDRDYYLAERFKPQKDAYRAYIERMLTMARWPEPAKRADEILALETRIAEASWTRAESRDRDKTYNPYTVAELKAFAPQFPWDDFLKGARLTQADKVVVSQNTAVPKIAAIYAATPVETLQAWQAFHTTDAAAPYLSKRFVDANWEFQLKTLGGQPEQRPRLKRAINATNAALGEPLGRIYTARYFPPESKAKMEALVADLRTALKSRINGLTWMTPQTKAQAQEKLANFKVNVGYSPLVRDYAGLEVKADDLFGNVERSRRFEWAWTASRLSKPVDPNDWGRPPQTVNAWYRPTHNDITFPAGILQPPYFDPDADPAINYGAIGGVIGHEISHGFDDQGRKVDGEGVLRDWWTAEDATKFQVQAQRLGEQYDTYAPVPSDPTLKVNGKLTMGENIGDLGGLLMALDAYKLSLKGKPAPVIDGLTGEQRVFLGWAQAWRQKRRDETMRQLVVTDPHSPAQFRVDGVVRNIDAWYEAFGVKPGDALYLPPEQRVRIW